jgi:hypothetical protein
MRLSSVRFHIWSLMVVVAGVACLLSLPSPIVQLVLLVSIPVVLILGPAWVAPHGRRVEVAFWALALHPLLLLAWLSVLRRPGHCPPLYPSDNDALLEWPFFVAWLSRFYQPAFAALGGVAVAIWFPQRSVSKPLVALPIAWLTTVVVLAWDPFKLWIWAWD